jgi:hypothetical protein
MNGELERIWKEAAVTLSRCCPDICREGLKKFMKLLVEDSRCLSRSHFSWLKIKLGNKQV